MPMRKKIIAAIIALSVAFAAAFLIVGWFFSPRPVALADIPWSQTPPLFALSDIRRNAHKGVLFLRLKDAKEQFFPGEWKTFPGEVGDTFLFGTLPPGVPGAGERRLYIFSGDTIRGITPPEDNKMGVSDIRENSKKTHFFIQLLGDDASFYCILPVDISGKHQCQKINLNKKSEARWLPDQDKEDIAVLTEKKEMFSYTLSTNTFRFIDPKKESELHERMLSLFRTENDDAEQRRFWRLLNLLIIRDAQKWSAYRIPWNTRTVDLFSDGDHLLIRTPKELKILELSSRLIAPLIKDDALDTASILDTGVLTSR